MNDVAIWGKRVQVEEIASTKTVKEEIPGIRTGRMSERIHGKVRTGWCGPLLVIVVTVFT